MISPFMFHVHLMNPWFYLGRLKDKGKSVFICIKNQTIQKRLQSVLNVVRSILFILVIPHVLIFPAKPHMFNTHPDTTLWGLASCGSHTTSVNTVQAGAEQLTKPMSCRILRHLSKFQRKNSSIFRSASSSIQESQEKHAQICAEGCEEEYFTHIFQIQLKHNLSALNEIKQRQMEFNSGKQG